MNDQVSTVLLAHKDKILSQLETALRVGALDNRGVLTSPRRAPEVAQQLVRAWFGRLAGVTKDKAVTNLAAELVEKGLSFSTGSVAMATLRQATLMMVGEDDTLKLTTLLAFDNFADTFLRKVAATRETVIVQEQESYQASLQRALQNELSQVRRLTERLDRRQKQMREVINIYSAIANLENEADILSHFVALAQSQLDLVGVAVFELSLNQHLVMVRASAGDLPETITPEATQPTGLLKQTITQNQPFISEGQEGLYEIFVPLKVGGSRTLGILALWLTTTEPAEDILGFVQPLAIMLTTTWQNVRLLAQAEERTQELETLQGQRVQQMWTTAQPGIQQTYLYDGLSVAEGHAGETDRDDLILPIAIREWPIGHLNLPVTADHAWSEEDLAFVEAIIREMTNALENTRLIQDTQSRARREQTIREITEKMRSTVSLQELVQTTARELGQHLSAGHAVVELGLETEAVLDHNGQNRGD
jgi:GAF domain-containing protein